MPSIPAQPSKIEGNDAEGDVPHHSLPDRLRHCVGIFAIMIQRLEAKGRFNAQLPRIFQMMSNIDQHVRTQSNKIPSCYVTED
jgi:hypothetical protein